MVDDPESVAPLGLMLFAPAAAFESAGADALRSVEISIWLLVQVAGVFVLQLMAVVTLKDCGPVPAGGAIPGVMLMVKRHVVFEGLMTPLSARRIAKLPGAPVPGDVGHPSETGEVCVVNPPPFSVADAPPAVMSCAEIVPHAYFSPFGSVIVPVTVVKPPWARTAVESPKLKVKKRRTLHQFNVRLSTFDFERICIPLRREVAVNLYRGGAGRGAHLRNANLGLQRREKRRAHPKRILQRYSGAGI